MFTTKTKILLLKGIITKKSPIYVQYAVTKRCNLRCRMCDSSISRKSERDLNLEEISIIASNLSKIGTGVIVLTGGEPFLREDLPEIVKIFSSKGLTVRLQTNGILATEEKIKKVFQAGLKEITISLDTLEPQKEDTITSQNGSWHEIIKSMVRFSQILPTKGTLLGINALVSKQNIEDVIDIIKLATRIGFWCSLIPVHLAREGQDEFIIRKNAPEFAFQPSDYDKIDRIYARIIRMKKQGYNVYNSYKFLRNSPEFLKGKRILWHCDSPYLYFAISPSGNFLPCVDLKTNLSILDKDFPKKYRSKEFRDYIASLVKNCKGCYYACWPEITYLCRDVTVLAEKLFLGIKTSFNKRKPVTYKKCLEIIENIKNA